MALKRLGGATLVLCLCAAAGPAADDPVDPTLPDGASAFRVFLTDGSSLVSYGELARVDDRVVFSMPTSTGKHPPLHLVNLSASHVDWERTDRYAETVRAARYMSTMAESHYAMLTAEIAQALNAVTATADPAARLEIAERARRTLADWPAQHFGYRQGDIAEMLGILDEAIADLRAAAGVQRFDLSLVASSATDPGREPLLPLPSPSETIEQTLLAARLADSPAERVSLLAVALGSIDREAESLPPSVRIDVRRDTRNLIAAELETDRVYALLHTQMLSRAAARARAADVRGVQRVRDAIEAQDRALGGRRRDTVNALMAAVDDQLDAARRLRLERDKWAIRMPEFQRYQAAVGLPLQRLGALTKLLEDIKALAGSGPDALGRVLRLSALARQSASRIVPPAELEAAHALLLSAAQLADSAARTRREAALTGSIARAWDASAAAAGALMLTARARTEIQAQVRLPQLQQ